ncbi:methyltransferase domain-containing protein [Litchfieldia alkalitelluris]|uniref:methyltransferase domain-containing protein n=1 Tax=Litchfieldia alkalitelluris TaxID=304268 RepID=UPI000998DB05|nr:methyltransferase domain-containing protein [Litchfieldia alkalitelluris]
MLSYYSKLSSEVYDLDKPIGHSFGDVEYYLERLSHVTARILEPATGTGRMLIPLLEKGFEVDGFDISTEMLMICREHCKARELTPNLFEEKMETFSMDVKYGAIIIPSGTFLLIQDRETSLKALENFYHHLEKGGRLIVDLFLQPEFIVGKVSTRKWECENGDIITLQNTNAEIDYINQCTLSYGRYEKWRNGTLIQTELESFPLRWYGVDEFKMILKHIGFKEIVVSSDYKYGQYPKNGNQMITFEGVK